MNKIFTSFNIKRFLTTIGVATFMIMFVVFALLLGSFYERQKFNQDNIDYTIQELVQIVSYVQSNGTKETKKIFECLNLPRGNALSTLKCQPVKKISLLTEYELLECVRVRLLRADIDDLDITSNLDLNKVINCVRYTTK